MQLSVLTVLFSDKSFEECLSYLKGLGIHHIELGCGGFPGKAHCNPEILLNDNIAFENFKQTLIKYEIGICALAVHGNPVHPQKSVAQEFQKDFENATLLAEKLGIDTLITFSGCPGDSENSKYPNWVTCPWPPDNLAVLEWQWNEVLIPYWKKTAEFCKKHGVTKIALEMHPSFCVYNPESLLKLRAAVGDVIGANVDPSHLIWQGIDVNCAIKALKGAIYHFHAKDTKIDIYNKSINGVLDTKHFGNSEERSWLFRTVGYGSSEQTWKDIFSTLRLVNYDKVVSIEHEDSFMSPTEGLEKAIAFLKNTLIFEKKPGEIWWA